MINCETPREFKTIDSHLRERLMNSATYDNFQEVKALLKSKSTKLCGFGICTEFKLVQTLKDLTSLFDAAYGDDRCSLKTHALATNVMKSADENFNWSVGGSFDPDAQRIGSLLTAVLGDLVWLCTRHYKKSHENSISKINQNNLDVLRDTFRKLAESVLKLDFSKEDLSESSTKALVKYYLGSSIYRDNPRGLVEFIEQNEQIVPDNTNAQQTTELTQSRIFRFFDEHFNEPCSEYLEQMKDPYDAAIDYVRKVGFLDDLSAQLQFYLDLGVYNMCKLVRQNKLRYVKVVTETKLGDLAMSS